MNAYTTGAECIGALPLLVMLAACLFRRGAPPPGIL